jgi:hypothetical protein
MKRLTHRTADVPPARARAVRPGTAAGRSPLQTMADAAPGQRRLAALQARADVSRHAEQPRPTAGPIQCQAEEEALQGKALQRQAEEEELLQGKALQRQAEEEEPLQGKALQRQEEEEPLQAKPEAGANRTGMPDRLKAGVEALSGVDMSGVRVQANSPEPARVNALAYAQGNDIHLAPGQERHLPHEAWHVVQQRQGRVQPTLQAHGAAINDDPSLEREADVMGARAMATGAPVSTAEAAPADVTQRHIRSSDC